MFFPNSTFLSSPFFFFLFFVFLFLFNMNEKKKQTRVITENENLLEEYPAETKIVYYYANYAGDYPPNCTNETKYRGYQEDETIYETQSNCSSNFCDRRVCINSKKFILQLHHGNL